MTDVTGQCLCGAVRYTASLKTHEDGVHLDACHCNMCRKQLGGPFLGVEATKIEFDDPDQVATYASSDWAERMFCKTCGSNMGWRMKNAGLITIGAGTIDNAPSLNFAVEIFIDEKPEHYAFAGERKRMTGAEVVAAFLGGAESSH